MKSLREQKNFWSIMAIFLALVCMGANSACNSVLSKIMASFPDASSSTIRLISTLPSVFTTVITLAVGPIVGRKIGYRPVLMAALSCIVIGGAAPAVFNSSLILILIGRAIYGVGLGLMGCRNGYLMLITEGEVRQTIISTASLITSGSGILLNIIGGWLGDISWRFTFCLFLIGIIPLFLVITKLKEPEGMELNKNSDNKEKINEKVSGRTYLYCLLMFVLGIAGMTWMTGMSALMSEKGFESSAIVALAISSCQAGSVCASLLFKRINKKGSRYTISIASLLGALGAAVAVFAKSVPLMMMAGLMAGLGYIISTISCNTYSAMSTSRSTVTIASTRVLAMQTLATFCTGFYIELCGKTLTFAPTFTTAAFIGSIAIQVLVAVVGLFVDLGPKPYVEAEAVAEEK